MALGGNITVNSTPLDPQPSRFEWIPPKAKRTTVLNGGEESAPRAKGSHFKLTYGDQRIAMDESLDSLQDALGNPPGSVTLGFTDHAGNSQSFTIQVDELMPDIIGVGGIAEQFTIELVEAP